MSLRKGELKCDLKMFQKDLIDEVNKGRKEQ